ncbi:hypothetical protein [Nonomuraea pusilla]|uniref:Uncharacterized protein n=1 Tax=Nonomuraea pusilla TaxID=46177 RepID=A0A1H8KCK0_9ACTN|nr:hypothetical protein [Nonomuraea pusilla]SEN90700.1 hypothetical protein SAMN05660976_08578 [Nonomuraea pusilla]
MTDIDRLLDEFASKVGSPYGMSAEQVVSYLAIGDRQHGDAPDEECGAVDPRDESAWCRRPVGHQRAFHCRYRLDEDWPEVSALPEEET